jgi:hypothetical protein
MGRSSNGGNKLLSILCALALILSTAISLVWVNFDRTLMVSSTYKKALVEERFYDRLPAILADQLVRLLYSGKSSDKVPSLFKSTATNEMEKGVTLLLPAEQVRLQSEDLLDQIFAYINGQQDSIQISWVPFKQRLAGPDGLEAALQMIRSQPVCTFEQLQQILTVTFTGEGDLVLCRPSDELLELLSPLVQFQINILVTLIPDSVTVSIPAGPNPTNFGPFGQGPAGGMRLGLLLFRLSPLLPLFFLILISLLAVRTVRDLLRWWGIPAFSAGLLTVITGIIVPSIFEWCWSTRLIPRLPVNASLELVSALHDLIRVVFQNFLSAIYWSGGVLAFLGLIMWIASVFIKERAAPPGTNPEN